MKTFAFAGPLSFALLIACGGADRNTSARDTAADSDGRALTAAPVATVTGSDSVKRSAPMEQTASQQQDRQDLSSLNIIADNAWFVVVDQEGRRTGYIGADTQPLREIPNSVAFIDALGGAPGKGESAFAITVNISGPAAGSYSLQLTAASDGPILYVDAFSADGSDQPSIERHLGLEAGARAQFTLHFSPAVDSEPRLERGER